MPGYKDVEPRWQPGESGNPAGRPKGSRNRATVMREWLALTIRTTNPLTGHKEKLSIEEVITLSMVRKAVEGSTPAYVALMDSAYGKPAKNR